MLKEIIIPISAIIVVALTYFLTKKRERESEWRKSKLEFYKQYVEALTGIAGSATTVEGKREFAKAANNLLLFAPQSVLNKSYEFREFPNKHPNATLEEHDAILSSMMLAMREDIGILPKDDLKLFSAKLWAASQD